MNALALTPKDMVLLAVGLVLTLSLVKKNATGIVAGTVSTGIDVAAGVPLGVGDAIGIPRTDKTQCQKDLDAGHWWDASFSCPAGTYIGGVWGGMTGANTTKLSP